MTSMLAASRVKLLLVLLGLALALGACPKHESPQPIALLPTTNASVPAPTSSQAAPPRGPDAGSSGATALPDFADLGSPCPASESRDVFCSDGVVVGMWRRVDTVREPMPPPSAELIVERPPSNDPRHSSLSVGIDGGRLFVRLVTCGGCRRVLGWAFVVDLPGLTDDQRRIVQERLGLPSEPLLRTANDFRKAFGTERGDAGISGKKP